MRAWIAGAAVCAVLLAGPAAAQSSCAANRQFTYDFTNRADQQLSYASTYNWSATNGLGASQAFTIGFSTYNLSSTTVSGLTMPQIGNAVNDGMPATGRNLLIGMVLPGRTADIGANSRVVVTTISFPVPIRDFSIQVNDLDFGSNQFRDWFRIIGSNAGVSYIPAISTPFGTDNGAGPKSAAGSTLLLGPSTTPLTVAQQDAIGTAGNGNSSNGGTLTVSFAQPVTQVQLRYGNSGQSPGGSSTGQQFYGVQRFSWCAMPQLTLTKTSATLDPTGVTRFSVPGADLVYAITLANNGGSDIDLNGLTADDLMPANMAFYNGDFSGTVVGPFEFTATGGAVVTGGAVTYSNNGTTYGYTPAAGYDANVRALRLSGTGTIPPGGALVVRFRARVN